MMDSTSWTILIVGTIITVVLGAALLVWRGRTEGPGLRDFLGISAAFVVLCWFTLAMIIGEYALG